MVSPEVDGQIRALAYLVTVQLQRMRHTDEEWCPRVAARNPGRAEFDAGKRCVVADYQGSSLRLGSMKTNTLSFVLCLPIPVLRFFEAVGFTLDHS